MPSSPSTATLKNEMRSHAAHLSLRFALTLLLFAFANLASAQFLFPEPPEHPGDTTPPKPEATNDAGDQRWVPDVSYAFMLGSETRSEAPRFEAIVLLDDLMDLPLTLRAELASHQLTRNEARLNLVVPTKRFYLGGGMRYGQPIGVPNASPALRGGALIGAPLHLNEDLTVLAEFRADTPFDHVEPAFTAAFGIQYHP